MTVVGIKLQATTGEEGRETSYENMVHLFHSHFNCAYMEMDLSKHNIENSTKKNTLKKNNIQPLIIDNDNDNEKNKKIYENLWTKHEKSMLDWLYIQIVVKLSKFCFFVFFLMRICEI